MLERCSRHIFLQACGALAASTLVDTAPAFSALNASGSEKRWFKGNLHVHNQWSDGYPLPEWAIDWHDELCGPFSVIRVFYLYDRLHHGAKWGLGAHQYDHCSSRDLIHWTHHPLAAPSDRQWECAMGTGNVIHSEKDGRWYALYTDCGSRIQFFDKLQRGAWLFRSVIDDGIHFRKDFKPVQPGFDSDIFYVPETGQFHLIAEGGRTPVRLADLENWSAVEDSEFRKTAKRDDLSFICPDTLIRVQADWPKVWWSTDSWWSFSMAALSPMRPQLVSPVLNPAGEAQSASRRAAERSVRRGVMYSLVADPGGPSMSKLRAPAAAITKARLAISWPRTSA